MDFVAIRGVLVIWTDSQEPADKRRLRSVLERHAFIVEVGTIHGYRSGVSARRSEMNIAKVA
jgi:hypothetical protein